jgi:hypothetical protein
MNYKRAPRDQALRSQGSLNEGVLSRCARGERLIASNARFGLIPLRCGSCGLRGFSPRSQGTLGQEGLSSAIALGGSGCRRSYARFGPIPLRCGFGWAPRDQALRSQGSLNEEELSRCAPDKDQRSSRRMAS